MKRLISLGIILCVAGSSLWSAPAVEVRLEGTERQVRVEGYDSERDEWVAVASGYPAEARSGWLKMALPEGWAGSELRVIASDSASPFTGRIASADAAKAREDVNIPGMAFMTADGATTMERDSSVEVEEADIWSWQGDQLFIYNQYRGLQVIDMEDSTQPEWVDAFRYPARGEDMYALDDGTVIVIGTGAYWNGQSLEVKLLNFDGATLTETDTVDLGIGSYMDSRRYGDHLYVMMRNWETEELDGVSTQRPVMTLHAIALKGSGERVVDSKTFVGSGYLDAVMTAQPEGILVCVNKWSDESLRWRSRWYSEVHVLLPDVDGTLQELGTAILKGTVKDKFKLAFDGELLTTISQETDRSSGAWTRTTYLENFSINGGEVVALGSLELAPGENLFATRFYGDTIYVVTFLMVDPLFAIDNSDPSNPRISGELKVPGWSNYIEWVDQWLFAIGYEDNKMTVSTFDVSDPENMSLVDRVFLSEDSWVGSEAMYDDQAIAFFPERRLFMLPFQTYGWWSTDMIQAMQIISWDEAGQLSLRGTVEHLDVPRRGTIHEDTMVTVSGRELLTTDLTDLDLPIAGGKAVLAWDVTKLYIHENAILQLEERVNSAFYYPMLPQENLKPLLVVTGTDDANLAQLELELDPGRIIGSHFAAGQLTLIQEVDTNREDSWTVPEDQTLLVTVYDFQDPLSPAVVSQSERLLPYIGDALKAVSYADSLIWTNASNTFGYVWIMFDAMFPGGVGATDPAYLVTGVDESTGSVVVKAHGTIDGGDDFYDPFSEWHWSPPLMMVGANRGSYVDVPTGTNYVVESRLQVIDFSSPEDPYVLPSVGLPSSLKEVRKIGAGPEHYLYFGGGLGVSVWGWDGINAFEIFKQSFGDAAEQVYWSEQAWVDSILARRGNDYSQRPYESQLQFWWHDPDANAFVQIGVESFGNDYPIYSGTIEGNLLLFGDRSYLVHAYELDAAVGDYEKLFAESTGLQTYHLQLGGSALEGSTLFIPAGIYGVEKIEGVSIAPAVENQAYRQLAGNNDWREVPSERWSLVERESSEHSGVIRSLRWLFRPDGMREVDTEAVDSGDNWRDSAWLGWYAHSADDPAWIQHLEHGHLFTVTSDTPERDGVHLYDSQLGYVWTRADSYPWLYRYNTGEWIYYLRGSGLGGTRWFKGIDSGWISLER